jgi:NADP-dependent 3-hydroxy acid dehydrogenase YdfG
VTAKDQGIAGCTAVVTGASSGIGAATASTLAEVGAAVVLIARRTKRLAALADKISACGGTALALPADVTDHEQVRRAMDDAASAFGTGRIDILVNNAGVVLLGPAATAALDDWRSMVDVNLTALLACTHAALPHLVRAAEQAPRGVADLVNIGSVVETRVLAINGVYAGTKRAVGAITESLRQELAPRHVRAAVVRPGAVDVGPRTYQQPDLHVPENQQYRGHRIDPRHIGNAIAYVVTRPREVAVHEITVRPTEQAN